MSVVESADAIGAGALGDQLFDLSFEVTVDTDGFYTLWTSYSQPNDINGKIQNLSINDVSKGQLSFPYTESFIFIKASPKLKLMAGSNTIGIVKFWGWVNIDYIEITPFISTPFSIAGTLVTPNAIRILSITAGIISIIIPVTNLTER